MPASRRLPVSHTAFKENAMPLRIRYQQWRTIVLISTVSVLAGCGSAPRSSTVADASRPQAAGSKRSPDGYPALPPARSGRGGYYLDDGPGDDIPEGLLDTPDPEPRVEPYGTRGNRPYVVFGVQYVPIMDERPLKQRGIGSWYGRKFHGQKTSSGEPYDMYKMTAAHPTLPIPSYVRVTNLANGRQVIVRVNDRGPFHSSRIIDLSYVAALKLGYLGKGSSQLEVERLLPEEIARIASGRGTQVAGASQAPQPPETPPQPQPQQPASPEAQSSRDTLAEAITSFGKQDADSAEAKPAVVAINAPASSATLAPGYYIQLGAYSQASSAEAIRTQLTRNWDSSFPPLGVVRNGSLYRVHGGPFATRAEAASAASQLEKTGGAGGAKPMIVQR
jgi:rare lipoprotein A